MDIRQLKEELEKVIIEDHEYDDDDYDFMSWQDFENEVANYVIDKNKKITNIKSYLTANSEKIVNRLIKKNDFNKLVELWSNCPNSSKEIYDAMRKDIIAYISNDEVIEMYIEDGLGADD